MDETVGGTLDNFPSGKQSRQQGCITSVVVRPQMMPRIALSFAESLKFSQILKGLFINTTELSNFGVDQKFILQGLQLLIEFCKSDAGDNKNPI